MIISHKYKFIFIKTNKTAGTSLEVFLSGVCGNRDILTPVWPPSANHRPRNYKGLWNPINDLLRSKSGDLYFAFKNLISLNKYHSHIKAVDVYKRINPKMWNSYFKFCVERNPWDKTLSHYHMISKRSSFPLTFDEYLNSQKLCYNYRKYCDLNNRIMVDKVIKYETLNQDLSAIFAQLAIPFGGSLNIFEKSHYRMDRRHYREVFTPVQKKFIENAFHVEIGLHGYFY
jgi:hypothetical protein